MRIIYLLTAILCITGCAAPNYMGGKGGVPYHSNSDIRLVEGIIQLNYLVVEDALQDGADVNALHDLSTSIPRFWIHLDRNKPQYTPLGALLRTSRSSELNRRLREEQQYTLILNALLDHGVDANSRLGQLGVNDMSMQTFSKMGFLRGPSATIGMPILYKKGLNVDQGLFQTRSFTRTELRILREKQPEFWSDINAKFENVLGSRLYELENP